MWNSQYAKTRQAAKRNRKKQATAPRLNRVKVDLKISGNLDPGALISGRLVLSEFSETGLNLFCPRPIIVGQTVSVTLEHPKRFFVKGRVISCQEILPPSKIISTEQFAYRLEIAFVLESDDEKDSIKAFRDELAAAGLTQSVPQHEAA